MPKKKDRKVSADRFKKKSVTTAMLDANENQSVVRPINPVINFPNLGSEAGDGYNYDMSKHYGKGFDDITNRVFYTATTLLNNSKDGSEKTKRGLLTDGYKYLSDYLEIWYHTLVRELTHEDITPELIEGVKGHLLGLGIGYAYNDDLDRELFEEMLREKYWVEEQIKFDWFDLDSPITGGIIADRIMQVRGDEEHIKTFKTKQDMVRAYSANIPIRSTGIGWCTNDDDGCMGGKCDECDHGIVDKNNLKHWEGMLIQQITLSDVDDIGEAGKAAAANGMQRCEKVLTSLGMNVEAMKVEIGNEIQAA